MRRIFISIGLSETVREKIKSQFWYWRDDLLKDLPIKWVDPENWHATLIFFGDRTDEEIELIAHVVQPHHIDSDRLLVRGMNSFGKGKNMKVLFLDLLGQCLVEYVEVLRESLKVNNILFDERPFRGHVTIGRVKRILSGEEVGLINKLISENREVIWGKMNFVEVVLYESQLNTNGSVYVPIMRFNNE